MLSFEWRGLKLLCATAFAVAGCGSEVDLGSISELRQAASTIPSTGFVPYRILTEELEPGVVTPVLAPDGSYQPAWDGSLADLMAADAFADCDQNSSVQRAISPYIISFTPGRDKYLQYLDSKMEQFRCEPDPMPGWSLTSELWVLDRQSSRCNIDTGTGQPTALDFPLRDLNQYESFIEHFEPDAWEDFFPVPGPSDFATFNVTLLRGAHELEYAHLNLCMAQHLRSRLNDGQSLFTSSSDQAEILAVIRERAQLAVVQYGLLAKVFSSDAPVPTEIKDPDFDFLVPIRHWAEEVDSGVLQTTGEDFSMAVRLHLDATHDLAELLQRQAATRPAGSVGLDRADRDWGLGQPRARLMNLLYGGDPIGTPELPYAPGRSRGGVGRSGTLPVYVRTDMQDPRIRTLLGLARNADALLMKVTTGEFDEPTGFDDQASADRLYRTVEVELRSQACELETPGDPSCEPSAIEPELPELSEVDEYLLWHEHRIEPGQALGLTQALSQAVGEAVQELSTTPLSSSLFRSQDGMLHLLGSHETITVGDDQWVHIDPAFTTAAFAGHELMVDFAELAFLPREILIGANPRKQGFVYGIAGASPSANADWEKIRNLGAVAALAFVREAIVEGSEAPAFAAPFFEPVSAVLPEIDAAVGKRSVIVRPKRTTINTPCGSATCQTFTQDFGSSRKFEVDVITRSEDPMDRLTIAPPSHQLHTVAVSADSVGLDGVDRADLDGYPTVSAVTDAYSGYAAGYEHRSFEYEVDDEPVRALLLRGDDPEGGAGEQVYMSLFAHLVRASSTGSDEAFMTSFGGALNALGQRAMTVQSQDWSRPAFDAFGLPVDWVPPADASLVGGAPGEPSYGYYLRSAKSAAEEATAAVQKAIENLVEETLQTVELEAAEQRASGIAGIETRALCGASPSCEIARTSWQPTIQSCALTGVAQTFCSSAASRVFLITPPLSVADEVVAAPSSVAPTFPEFEGGEIQRILVRQWNGTKLLQRAVSDSMDLAIGAGLQIQAANDAFTLAVEERDEAQSAIDLEIAELDAEDDEIEGLLDQVFASKLELELNVAVRITEAEDLCSPEAFEKAGNAGYSYTNPSRLTDEGRLQGKLYHVYKDEGKSWSPGALLAQEARCEDAREQAGIAARLYEPTRQALTSQYDALLARRETLDNEARAAMSARRSVALAAFDVALSTQLAVHHAAQTQFSSSLTQVQQALGEVVAAGAELDQAQLRLENAVASGNLERDLVAMQVDARFGVQRKYRSYDMWRARALLEGARRLSVAARRAIEARFVVDLSELDAEQAFVASPSIWADEVYAADLDAPSVVGLSAAPKIENAVYPNQLLDYVDNLERFVQGYTVSYPTSVASPDTEVLVLPGPEPIETIVDGEEVIELLAEDGLGWTFSCSADGGWLPHPGVGQSPLVARLATLCNGKPPSRMRYNFSLDPWARLNRSVASSKLVQRHNVRWRKLAVNLVGTGIRDCERAPNPQQCFSESYLRYQLMHSGPAWMTNHAQQWRAFELPTAFIEGGKALASEEWLDPIANSWSSPFVSNVSRGELFGRPVHGAYELIVEISPDVRLERIDDIQLLIETDYWVRQQ